MKLLFALAVLAFETPAAAEVVSASPNGFEVRETVQLVVPPGAAYTAFGSIGDWWDPAHTYSGDAANLSLNLVPGGCFCERLPKSGGGIEHLRVTYVEPGKHIVFSGALGPLLYKPVAGGSQLILDYKAAGFAHGGADKLAAAVDQVLASQLKRFRAYATAKPKT
jgi:hypothetical protein